MATVEKWLKDLRSGEFEYCEGTLFNGEGYCALGLALTQYEDLNFTSSGVYKGEEALCEEFPFKELSMRDDLCRFLGWNYGGHTIEEIVRIYSDDHGRHTLTAKFVSSWYDVYKSLKEG